MKNTFKKWTGLGLTAALVGSTALVACSGENGEAGEAPVEDTASPTPFAGEGEMGEGEGEGGEGEGGEGEGGEGEGGEAGHDMTTLSVPHRLAFMSGHVQAGLALYRAGEPEMAAPHLLHPVSETHQAERAGLDELGFQPEIFESVSQALEEGRPASEIEPQLRAAEENMAMMGEKAGGDPSDIIRFLMDTVVDEYTVAITDGAVSDAGEYQDAWGFVIVARDHAASLPADISADVISEIDTLLALWPGTAPVPPAEPAPVGQVTAQTSVIMLKLPRD
ncbi:hypothetical protein FF098_004370 [Parvularcula flava]|uniref:DUF305 domain-containing protein n=1 Tax=Aquisalinus luteolus TaxID=1566827 RepID=A0A8J3A122_9PROT|nr:hypothetical protein [Aquisalinus luteolus]NHK27135.1 hypothetical protein [Aquisalinus luteolus]GGH94506.1 hypothetical protein GCM10011355_08850 [Aquisalinus luteolus]